MPDLVGGWKFFGISIFEETIESIDLSHLILRI